MLQDIRKSSQGTVAKIIVGVIIVVFALFGVESIVGSLSGEPEVAAVNGSGIPESRFLRALEGKRRQILAQMGERVDPDLIDEGLLRSSVLEGMIQEEILRQDAEEKGLYVSSAAVDNYIRNIEQFKDNGSFSNERMQMILRNAGLTLKDYRESLRSQFILNQSRSALIASAFVLEQERNEIITLDQQARSFGVATVFKRDYLDAVTVSDDEIVQYYEQHTSSYKKPRNVDVAYLEVDKSQLIDAIEVTDAEVRELYEAEKAAYVGEEERHAAHILIKIDDAVSDADALEKIKAIESRIKSGEAFATLATELSEDEGSADSGGDLGRSGRGVYVSDFEEALFDLKQGEISAPVKTEFGYHLIKLLAIETNEIPGFEEMKSTLVKNLQDQKVDQLYAEKTELLADLSYSSPDLAEPAEELGVVIKYLAGVSVETKDEIFSNVKVQRVLFSDELVKDKNNSDIIEVDDGRSIVFRVDSYHDESILALDDVKSIVRNELKIKKTSEFAESVGTAFIARISSGEDAEIVSEDMGLSWQVYSDVKRDNVMVNREIVAKVFAMKKSNIESENISGFRVLDGDYSVVMLKGISESDPSAVSSVEVQSISNMLGDSLGGGDYRNYQDVMVRKAEIERI